MASVQQRGDKFQLRVVNALLPKPFFSTFADEQEATDYGAKLEALLARGIVPQELLAAPARRGDDPLLATVIRDYTKLSTSLTSSDSELLDVVVKELPGLRVSGVTFGWAEGYVRDLKLKKLRAPGTIRKRIGVLARVLDWHGRRLADADPQGRAPVNPLRLLPVGYSQYTPDEARLLALEGKEARVDEERDVRLPPDQETLVRRALAGEKRKDRERALEPDPDFTLLFDLVIDTGLRLSEAFKMRVEQVDLQRGVLRVEGSKGARGLRKPRVVPLKRHLRDRLKAWVKAHPTGRLLGLWDGSPETVRKTSNRLSTRFSKLFEYAGLPEVTEHDLRHEATCRWFELRNERGWVFSDMEICRIMGWKDPKMALRYASLRGEDLADRL